MSTQAQTNVVPEVIPCLLKRIYIDTAIMGQTVAVHDTGYDVPDQHAVAPVCFRTDTAFSDNSTTISFGTDSASEPDNWLDDTATSGLTADSVTECTYDGSASTLDTNVTGSGKSLYYEIKTAALTAGSGWLYFYEFKLGE